MIKVSQVKTLVFSILLFNSLAISIAIAQSIFYNKTPGYYFRERAFITYISGLQLLIITYINYKILLIINTVNSRFTPKSKQLCKITTLGFLFLALDEMLQIHENIDALIHYLLNIKPTFITDRIDDIIILFYLIISLIILIQNRQVLKLFKKSFAWFKIGFIFSFLMIVLDIITNDDAILSYFTSNREQLKLLLSWISVGEESCKLMAEGMFILGFFRCWHIVRQLSRVKS